MTLLQASPDTMVLLTAEQHKSSMLDPKISLVWFNLDGKFIGPYTYKK